ncbi:MAG: HEAT repeat domain-containing protein [Pirellulaceae bacterium]|nr:HEAT repeat domain-containing protein [Pirellulaceae bacterium]
MNAPNRLRRPEAFFLAAAMFALPPHPASGRIWTDSRGRKVDADLVRVDSATVVLRVVATKREHFWPLTNLSERDQAFATSTFRLVTSLRSRDEKRRDEAVEKLADIGVDAVPSLIEELKHKNGCEGSIEALVRIGEQAVPYSLRRLSTTPLNDVERSRKENGIPNPAATALLRMPAPTLRASLEQGSKELRVSFLSHVGAAPGDMLHGATIEEIAVSLLPALLDSQAPSVVKAAESALVRVVQRNTKDASTAAFQILRQRVEGADLPTRLECAIETCRDEGGIIPLFTPPPVAENFVRSTVMEALTESGDDEARRSATKLLPFFKWDAVPGPDLIKLLKVDDLPQVRRVAVGMLGSRGADAKPAIPALVELLKAREQKLATTVLSALEKIGLSEPGGLDALVDLAGEGDEATCAALRNLFMRQRAVLFNKQDSADVLGRLYQAVLHGGYSVGNLSLCVARSDTSMEGFRDVCPAESSAPARLARLGAGGVRLRCSGRPRSANRAREHACRAGRTASVPRAAAAPGATTGRDGVHRAD